MRYGAFISYSHADAAIARWLHHTLETYRLPRKLVGSQTPYGTVARRLPPIFRDRDELPASGDLGTELRAALADSAFQIVLCSERAAKSHWVNEEILAFKRVHGDGRVLALIVDGEPYSADHECFPPALKFKTGAGGILTTDAAEPIAADIRPGKDGRRLASLKLIAGLTGVPLDQLVRRDEARRRRRLLWIAGGALGVAAVTLVLAFYALAQRDAAREQRAEAERQRDLASTSLDFLIGTFSIADPATENPRTITALTILDRVSGKAEAEMRRNPQVGARLLTATGSIYFNLGLPQESQRDLMSALRLEPSRGEARATTLMQLAELALKAQDEPKAAKLIDAADQSFDPRAGYAPPLSAKLAELRGKQAFVASKFPIAVDHLRDALTLYRKLPGNHTADTLRILSDEGKSLAFYGKLKEAGQVYEQAYEISKSINGPWHLTTAAAMSNRAYIAYQSGNIRQADFLAHQAYTTMSSVLDPSNPKIGNLQIMIGRIKLAENQPQAATDVLDEALRQSIKIFGLRSAATGDVAFFEAEALSNLMQFDRANAMLAIVQNSYDASYPAVDLQHAELLEIRAQISRAAGDRALAEASCARAIAIRTRLDPKDPDLPRLGKGCADILADPPRVTLLFH